MAQWGRERTFTDGETTMRVMPAVVMPTVWSPLSRHGRIADLMVLSCSGPAHERLSEKLKAEWVGRNYEDWI
jgi:hypothetical protein